MVVPGIRIIAAALAAVLLPLAAAARVGVTSASDGDPLGKPPNENERILRIGIDVQADEQVTTGPKDRAHLVFLDGSSLTVGPNARLAIDRFVFDPGTSRGELTINATKGVLRLVGGRISKTSDISIVTPSSTIGIRGGIAIVSVGPTSTIADFVYGTSMTVTANGRTERATRAGSQVVTGLGGVPGAPSLLKPGSLGAALNQLEGATPNDNRRPDQSAQQSGFSARNSGQAVPASSAAAPGAASNALVNALSNANAGTQAPTLPDRGARPATTPASSAPPAGAAAAPVAPMQTLSGYAAGLAWSGEASGGWHDTGRRDDGPRISGRAGAVTIAADPATGQGTATLVIRDFDRGVRDPHRQAGSEATLQLGGPGRSVVRGDGSYAMVTATDPLRPSTVTRHGARSAVTDVTVLASMPRSATASCACEFLTWGWWASRLPEAHRGGPPTLAAGAYVAGRPSTPVQLPQTGIATYAGFMAGIASAGGVTRAATGSFSNTWNFGTRSGVFTGSFDGRGYAGTTQATPGSNGSAFTGSFSGGSRTGALTGAFMAAPGDPAAYQAGTFAIGGGRSGYRASGVFAGQR